MDTLFPFGFPRATAFYLTFYVLTLVIHVAFMNYVLAGTMWMAVASFRRPIGNAAGTTIADVLRDWMPFALSAAITAGVAPLLFIQILYQQEFYTANLLLSHRWMAIVPVLIVGFYLLYLLKTRRVIEGPRWVRVLIAFAALGCIAFVGVSWTRNHLLALTRWAWADYYVHGADSLPNNEATVRFALWFLGSFPTMLLGVAWQLWFGHRHGQARHPAAVRRAGNWVTVTILASAVCAIVYSQNAPAKLIDAIQGPLAKPYFLAATGGLGIQLLAWGVQWRQRRFSAVWLTLATGGLVMTLLGVTVVRESLRLGVLGSKVDHVHHNRVLSVNGFPVFLLFFALNAILITWCFILVRRNLRAHRGTSA